MSQFTVYKNNNRNTRKAYPYFLDVQHALLDDLNSRVVIPFSEIRNIKNINAKRLCPVVSIDNKNFALLTHQITTVPSTYLEKSITDLSAFRDEIIGAIDLLITGI